MDRNERDALRELGPIPNRNSPYYKYCLCHHDFQYLTEGRLQLRRCKNCSMTEYRTADDEEWTLVKEVTDV